MIYKASPVKRFLLKIKYGPKSDSETYKKYLKNKGIKIGNNVEFNSPWTIDIDYAKPWLVSIGNNVIISSHVSIIAHGSDWRILQNIYGDVIGSGNKIRIGNNVFIGIGTIILKNVIIGNNVIIGAGSVVTKNLESNGVYAGNPAKYIMSIDDYYKKRINMQNQEMLENIVLYKNKYDKYPNEYDLREYFFLFTDRNEKLKPYMRKLLENGSDYEKSKKRFYDTEKIYNNFSDAVKGGSTNGS